MKFLLLLTYFSFVQAAPFPVTSSSAVLNGLQDFETSWGLKLHNNKNAWSRILAPPEDPMHLVSYRKIEGNSASSAEFHLRVDPWLKRKKEGEKINLKSYTSYWTKMFPKFGLEVIQIKFTKFKDFKVSIIDSYNPESQRQVRQFLLWGQDRAVIASCSDDYKKFNTSYAECYRIFESIQWNQTTLNQSQKSF